MLPFLLAAITLSSAFEGGSAGRVETASPAHLRIAVQGQADQNQRNRQANWYFFKLENLPRTEVRIDLVDLVGEYNFRPGTHAVTRNTRPVYSFDGETWSHFSDSQVSWDEAKVELTLRFTPERRAMWIAHVAPYTHRHLERLLRSLPGLEVASVGKSVRGRDILLVTVPCAAGSQGRTPSSAPDPRPTGASAADQGVRPTTKKVVWVMARQHAWETGTSWAVEGALKFLMSKEALPIRRAVTFRFFPMADPDGVASGAVRFNANGYDLNRNWDLEDAAAMPEIAALKKALTIGPIDLFLAMHNQEANDYIAGPPGALRDRLQALLDSKTAFYSPKGARDLGQADKGRMTVYQWLWNERRAPAFLMEQGVERSPRLGRPPTVADRLNFGAELVRVLAEAVTSSAAP